MFETQVEHREDPGGRFGYRSGHQDRTVIAKRSVRRQTNGKKDLIAPDTNSRCLWWWGRYTIDIRLSNGWRRAANRVQAGVALQ
jgi:hypothetical protein